MSHICHNAMSTLALFKKKFGINYENCVEDDNFGSPNEVCRGCGHLSFDVKNAIYSIQLTNFKPKKELLDQL